MILTISLLSLQKRVATPALHRSQTVQLRGLAALLVIVGHFWGYVASAKPLLISHGETVMLFLFFSGFGIELSYRKHRYTLKEFFNNRLRKVMVPYWIVTLIIIVADYLFIDRGISLTNLLLTTVGINTSTTLNHLDYARWYITFLLIWYLVSWISREFSNRNKTLFLLAAIISLFVWYRPFTFSHQFLAYPLGVFAALHYKKIKKKEFSLWQLLTIGHILLSLWAGGKVLALPASYGYIPWTEATHEVATELLNLLFLGGVLSIAAAFGKMGLQSRFLLFSGNISYYIFLLHGAFLIKYNPITALLPDAQPWVILPLFFLFIFLLSSGVKKMTETLLNRV
ncbi:acyltransferase [bacterium]|nr:acyltransferase [bacterium]